MQSVRYEIDKPNSIKISEVDLPIPVKDEVVVRIAYVTICGSDVHLYKGTYGGPAVYPILFGHEWSGTVVAVGPNVKHISAGDLVTGDCSRFCGECPACEVDPNVCRDIEKFGITVDGASCEYLLRREKYLYRAPKDMDPMLLSLTEPIAVAAHLMEKIIRVVGPISGKKILILGAGGIGLGALLLVKHRYGCKDVACFDISEKRMSTALRLGASNPGDILGSVSGSEGASYGDLYGAAKFDIVIETTGNAEVFAASIKLANPLGTVGCLGMIPVVEIAQKLIVVKALTIVGSIGGTGDFPEVMDFIQARPDAVRPIISHVFQKTEIAQAMEMSRNGREALKVCIDFNGKASDA